MFQIENQANCVYHKLLVCLKTIEVNCWLSCSKGKCRVTPTNTSYSHY